MYCNDRSIYQLGGMNPNGGALTISYLIYSGYNRNYVTYNPSTKCLRPQDAFTKEASNGNGLLDYSVGLVTIDELAMAGGKLGTANANFYLYTGVHYWSLSLRDFYRDGGAIGFFVVSTGSLSGADASNNALGLRPVISLKPGISMLDGTGTGADPYIVK